MTNRQKYGKAESTDFVCTTAGGDTQGIVGVGGGGAQSGGS